MIKAGDSIDEVYRLIGEPLCVVLRSSTEMIEDKEVTLTHVKALNSQDPAKPILLAYSELKERASSNLHYDITVQDGRVVAVTNGNYID